jgi:tetratricopeptide (TPR) repeat protein
MRQILAVLLVLLSIGHATVLAGETEDRTERDPSEQDKVVAQALAESGHEKFQAKEYEAAEQLLRQALEKHPAKAQAVYDLARVSQWLEKYEEATELFRRYLKLTEGEGKTQQRVMAGIYLEKLDRKYGEMAKLREQAMKGAEKLLTRHEDALSREQKSALNDLLAAFGEGLPDEEQAIAPDQPDEKQEAPESEQLSSRQVTRMLNRPKNWKVEKGDWDWKEGVIKGSGDSSLTFQRELPPNFMLTFDMRVTDGMRPRVHLCKGLWVGNEGFKRVIYIYGPLAEERGGKPFPYKKGQNLSIRVRLQGDTVGLGVNGQWTASAKRKKIRKGSLRLQGGDGWSPGTTLFSDFRAALLPSSEE